MRTKDRKKVIILKFRLKGKADGRKHQGLVTQLIKRMANKKHMEEVTFSQHRTKGQGHCEEKVVLKQFAFTSLDTY